jgi:hypothetical protein
LGTMETLLLPLFVANLVLVLIDASIGYRLAPLLFSASGGDPDTAEAGIRTIRRMLTCIVALYMFFNCLAYFRQEFYLLLLVTAFVLVDMGGQLYIRYRARQHDSQHDQ